MSEEKVVSRNVAIVLGVICLFLAIGLVGAFIEINSLNSRVTDLQSQVSNLNTQISNLQNQISSLSSQINSLNSIVATFTRVENLEISSAYAISSSNGWNVYITIKNIGSADATITTVTINGIQKSDWGGDASVSPSPPVTLTVGSSQTFIFWLTKNGRIGSTTLSSGITLNIVFRTTTGKDYPASVTLP